MSEMVERVARAIRENITGMPDEGWPIVGCGADHVGLYTEIARAALEAMREPTEAMMISAKQSSTGGIAPGDEIRYDPNDVWQAMIDAALGRVDAS